MPRGASFGVFPYIHGFFCCIRKIMPIESFSGGKPSSKHYFKEIMPIMKLRESPYFQRFTFKTSDPLDLTKLPPSCHRRKRRTACQRLAR